MEEELNVIGSVIHQNNFFLPFILFILKIPNQITCLNLLFNNYFLYLKETLFSYLTF